MLDNVQTCHDVETAGITQGGSILLDDSDRLTVNSQSRKSGFVRVELDTDQIRGATLAQREQAASDTATGVENARAPYVCVAAEQSNEGLEMVDVGVGPPMPRPQCPTTTWGEVLLKGRQVGAWVRLVRIAHGRTIDRFSIESWF